MPAKRTQDKQHRWLSQVEVTGVVFSEPVLAEAEPTGFPNLEKSDLAKFHRSREIWNLPAEMVGDDSQDQWIEFVLREILQLKKPSYWREGAAITDRFTCHLPLQHETLRPTRVLVDKEDPVLAMLEVPRGQSLDRSWTEGDSRWKASPTTKLERLLRETGVELGLVTNGESWRLLVASPSETASWLTWTVQSWAESPLTLAAFRDLLGEARFFAGDPEKVALKLIQKSRTRQLDVADQLGNQVIEALSLLVRELDRADAASSHPILESYRESDVFSAGVTYVMRLIFVLYAEENGLLPHGSTAYDRSYGILHLLTELENQHRIAPDHLEHSYAGYARALATARLIHAGSVDPDIRVAAHGGSLFNPDLSPLLEGRRADGSWPSGRVEAPRVRDSVLREILRSLKYAKADGSRQLVSYRTLEVEAIGHMYQGLLDRRVARAPKGETLFFLHGSGDKKDPDPIPASEIAQVEGDELLKLVAKHTGRSKTSLKDLLEKPEERVRLPDPGTQDVALLAQAEPVRRFLADRGIVRPGGLYLWFGDDRRSQGAHYTPSILTEPIVRTTLRPVLEALGERPTPRQLLDLKVCDPAVGSGAFLVQVIRQLSEHLVDSWDALASVDPDQALTMPFGEASEGQEDEALLPDSREERLIWARRYVAESCVYGVDRNEHAIEMAKLSLWIATLSVDRPFTFLDHALRAGDTLVGLKREQIASLNWGDPRADHPSLFSCKLKKDIESALGWRRQVKLERRVDYESRRVSWSKADRALADARMLGDVIVSSFFNADQAAARRTELERRRVEIDTWIQTGERREAISSIARTLREKERSLIPFHWEVEFPEVFGRECPGFDAIVGNPPYAGKNTIANGSPDQFPDWLKHLHVNSHGNADLVAHMFRRAFGLLRDGGCLGLVATRTIAQGDSRATGLCWICENGGAIFEARRRLAWPGRASRLVSIVHIKRGSCVGAVLDGRRVDHICAFLTEGIRNNDPPALGANMALSFIGTYVLGMGFTFNDRDKKGVASSLADMDRVVGMNPKSREVIDPYIGFSEVASHPEHRGHRYVINFGDRGEDECRRKWPELMEIVERRVKPGRMALKDNAGSRRRKRFWWQFGGATPSLNAAVARLERVIVAGSQASKHFSFAFLDAGQVFSTNLTVIASSSFAAFASLQGRVHEVWSRFFMTNMKDDLVYTPTTCFESFPFHVNWQTDPALEAAGKTYYEFRAELMVRNDEGLTKTYNRFHDPNNQEADIVKLRELHAAMDRAVLDAYGWDDISTDCEFLLDYEIDEETWGNKKKPYRYRWPDEVHDEVLARLLALNQERYQQEVEAGLHA